MKIFTTMIAALALSTAIATPVFAGPIESLVHEIKGELVITRPDSNRPSYQTVI